MPLTSIIGIKGGYEDPNDERPGAIWIAPLGGDIIDGIPGQEVEFVVEGYPSERYLGEPDSLVTVALLRNPARVLLLQLTVRLSTLRERPSLVTREM